MSYLQLRRLNFCYQLFGFFALIGVVAFMIMAITNHSILYACVAAVFALICAGCVKRYEMYQTKINNFDYKYYLDKKYSGIGESFLKWEDDLMKGKSYTKAEIEDVPGLQDMIDREIFGDE